MAQYLFDLWVDELPLFRPLGVGFSGFPFAGKTTIALDIVNRFGSFRSCHIPVESFIVSRDLRRRKNLNGCSPMAYDIDGIKSCIEKLSIGEIVKIKEYDWKLGDLSCEILNRSADIGGVYIIDGTISILEDISFFCDKTCFFEREENDESDAILRDVNERNWNLIDAIVQNRNKTDETIKLMNKYYSQLTDILKFRMNKSKKFEYRHVKV